jgi:hypothetical protein
MEEVQDPRDGYKRSLAKRFYVAFIAHRMGVTYKTAEKYADKGDLGELWLFLADLAIGSVNESINETFGRYFAPTDPILSAEILDDSE